MVSTRSNGARSVRTPATTTTGTPSTSVSPLLSGENSAVPETPDTSDVGEDPVVTKVATRSLAANLMNTRKRPTEDADEDEDLAARPVATKRRVIQKAFFVEIPIKHSTLNSKQQATPVKGKGRVVTSNDQLPSEDEDLSDGSEYIESDDDVPLPSKNVDDVISSSEGYESEGDEELMVAAAIELSRETARLAAQEYSGVGSSSRTIVASPSLKITKKGAAAERRLTQSGSKTKVKGKGKDRSAGSEDGDFMLANSDSALSALSSSEEEVPVSKGKGKGKATKKGKDNRKFIDTEPMTWVERSQQRRLQAAERRANKSEEYALMQELGRKLTYAEKSSLALKKYHPELKDVWGNIESSIPIVVPERAEQPAGLKVTLLPFQRESLSWMRKQEKGLWHGGMLADEMGMGKTIQMISLFVSDLKRPNLVVAPTVAIMQWRNEINTHTEGMNVLVWHGASRLNNPKELEKYDVVLTTYAVMESCFRKQQSGFKRKGLIVKEPSPLHQIKWNRIILDEAHNIKERQTNTAKASFELESNYKWCLSGTPLQNRVGELYSLVRFLGGDPFSFYFCKKCACKSLHWRFTDKRHCDDCGHSPMQHTCFWNNEILTPIQKHGMEGPGKIAFKKLRILLDRMMLRRTKIQRADDLDLPPRMVIVRRDYFSPEEKELYLSLFSDAKRQFSTYVDSGTVLNNYSNIFSLLTRMRQMACHPDLVLRSKTNGTQFLGSDEAGEATICRLCSDVAEDAIKAKCHHIFDRECMKQYLSTAGDMTPDCPVCHLPLTIDLEAPALELEANIPSARQGILGRLNIETWRSSSKIEALVEELSNLRLQDNTTKSIVFSQFVNFLDLIAFRLQKAGFSICRLEGTMSPQARDATIQHFMNNVGVTVFLVSLKAGGVALNLTEASRVYLMDSWWNPAVEYQAMDRIHRLGQYRPIQAIKLVVEDSIERRIVQLQEKKSAMVDATLSTDDSAMGRLTPDDLSFLFRL
ncbi:SNF2 family N-terminal domain-containing protein [Suillus clintonianus]|uniref:SNF2 family N-terminal domain-containing protein n=1 Tax=Suillus clintonianus TaxID=1904413 RepID=UPI001B8779D4|nr:SNF2 family N-terminal domain-containing protein [Suillus clintonianus]KAG2147944.1 SNF2 family N-terminal domain-containing protein [Suillus clintonianus]